MGPKFFLSVLLLISLAGACEFNSGGLKSTNPPPLSDLGSNNTFGDLRPSWLTDDSRSGLPTKLDSFFRDGNVKKDLTSHLSDAALKKDVAPLTWEITGQFTAANVASKALIIFGSPVTGGMVKQSFLNTNDETYTLYPTLCNYDGKTYNKPLTWHIERKRESDTAYWIWITGQSDADCNKGAPQVAGTISLNPQSGWRFDSTKQTCASNDNCTYENNNLTAKFSNNYSCSPCCACADGAGVAIKLYAKKN